MCKYINWFDHTMPGQVAALETRILGNRQIAQYQPTTQVGYRRFVATPVT